MFLDVHITRSDRASRLRNVGVFFFLVTVTLLLSCASAMAIPRMKCEERKGLPQTAQSMGKLKLNQPGPQVGASSLDRSIVYSHKSFFGLDADHKGPRAKALVMSFFATWCVPCKEGLPILQKVAKTYEAAGVEFWLIAVGESGSKVKRFLDELGIKLKVSGDKFHKISQPYGVVADSGDGGLPRTVVLDGQGIVRKIYMDEEGDFCGDLSQTLDGILAR